MPPARSARLCWLVLVSLLALAPAPATPQPASLQPTPAPLFPAFVLSLPHQRSRRARLTQLWGHALNLTFVEAVRGTRAGPLLAHPVELAPNLTGKDASHYSRSSPEYLGALGATVGHLRALAAAEAAGVDAALILEDDVVTDLLPFWQFGSLWDFVDRLPAGWSAVQLAMIASEDTWDSAFSAWSAAAWPPTLEADPFWSNAAYLVSRRALREFLAPPLRPEGQPGTFDLTVFHVLNCDISFKARWRRSGAYLTATPPLFTYAEGSDTDIHVPLAKGHDTLTFAESPCFSEHASYEFNRARIHKLSRRVALEWAALAWRRRAMHQSV